MADLNSNRLILKDSGETTGTPDRIIGKVTGSTPGSTLICIAGMHGNEPAGISALQRIFDCIDKNNLPIRGQLIGLSGNLQALENHSRFIDQDLNRGWVRDRIATLMSDPDTCQLAEDREILALATEIDRIIGENTGPFYFIDLHTTSGESPPFSIIADTLRNRAFAFHFPIPIILGLEEHLDGTLLEYLGNLGHITMVIEGGQHDNQESVERIEAGIWIAMQACGILANGLSSRADNGWKILSDSTDSLPKVLEVRYRHEIAPPNGFKMKPGYTSFQFVKENQLLAHDDSGEVRAAESGRILMPLYQSLGDDGFFLVREFRPVWLVISAFLRKLRLDDIVHLLPGVQRDPLHRGRLIVNRRVARWLVLQLFHLLGYRKRELKGDHMIISRRRYDLPDSIN